MSNDPNDRFMISDLSSKLSAYINGEYSDQTSQTRDPAEIGDVFASEIKPEESGRKLPGDELFTDLDQALVSRADGGEETARRQKLADEQRQRAEEARRQQLRNEQQRVEASGRTAEAAENPGGAAKAAKAPGRTAATAKNPGRTTETVKNPGRTTETAKNPGGAKAAKAPAGKSHCAFYGRESLQL